MIARLFFNIIIMKSIKHNYWKGWLCIVLIIFANRVSADVKLPRLIGNNMVLQQNTPVRIWGWADGRERVNVTFDGKTYKAKNTDGRWEMMLPATPAGGPYEMEIKGKNVIKISNILFGEVWICSGQSNMEWPVSKADNPEEEMRNADYPEIRLFTVPRKISPVPLDDIESGEWVECSPETIGGFSAVAYFFGRELHKELNVPVGLIHDSWGGTNVETWTSVESLNSLPDFKPVLDEMKTVDWKNQFQDTEKTLKEWNEGLEKQDRGLKENWQAIELDDRNWPNMEVPNLWEQEEGMAGIDGVVWFRKEVIISEESDLEDAVLSLGAIDDSDQTWINGQFVGETVNQYSLPRKYKLRDGIIKTGRNVIAVRVIDTGGGGGIWGEPDNMVLTTRGYRESLVGEWKFKLGTEGLPPMPRGTGPNSYPSLLFNGMLNPVIPYTIQGAIWYQGESNAGRAYQYRETFPLMIKDWRKHFGIEDFPFYFVQLANFRAAQQEPKESDWAELREAQTMTLSLPNTGMAVTIDIGNPLDIHPRNKQDVGKRLALNALAKTYKKDVIYSGPVFDHDEINGNQIIISFKNADSGLVVKDRYGYVKGFTIAGADKEFHWARAEIKENKVVVHCDAVKNPVSVRYAWEDNPEDANLYNAEGLPAVPFRTDDWKGMTYGVKYR